MNTKTVTRVNAATAETMLDVLSDIAHSSAFELPSDRVGLKAAQLVDDGSESVRGPRRAIVYTIQGEAGLTGFYQTTLYLRGTGRLREIVGHSCPCDARWQCAHVMAALVRAYQDGYKIAVT